MITIDCAGDGEMAIELERYLKSHGYDAKLDESSVLVNGVDVEKVLHSFLQDEKHAEYTIRKLESTSFLLSREIPIEDFGFVRCEMCGYVVSSEEELLVHRRAHGIQLL